MRSADGGVTWSAPSSSITSAPLRCRAFERRHGTEPRRRPKDGDALRVLAGRSLLPGRDKRNDVLVISSRDGGLTWSAPVKANDTPPTAQDAFTPVIQVDDNGRVGVLYYDLRDDASRKDDALVTAEWMTVSTDGGRTFAPSERSDSALRPLVRGVRRRLLPRRLPGSGERRGVFQPFFAANLVPQANGQLGSDVFTTRGP